MMLKHHHLNLIRFDQISFGATSDKFSDKELYPSFMRTVPTDKWQVEAMVELLGQFGWNWVAVVASEDEYGRQGQRQFSSLASERNICVAYEGLIPIYSDPVATIKDILGNIKNTNVGVVVLFSLAQPAVKFFNEVSVGEGNRGMIGKKKCCLEKSFKEAKIRAFH